MHGVLNWLRRRADNVAVGLLTAIFLTFLLQIVSRYVIRQPLGWTIEAISLSWLWLVFWSSAFILEDADHVRFTVLCDRARPKVRRIYAAFTMLAIVAALLVSLPATVDFVTFMKIEKTSLLKVRFDLVFSIYIVFAVAIIVRYVWRVVRIVHGQDGETPQ